MTAETQKAEATSAMIAITAMALPALRRISVELWHRINACSCDQGWILPGIPCEIGLEEAQARRQAAFFAAWDSVGLGYVGP